MKNAAIYWLFLHYATLVWLLYYSFFRRYYNREITIFISPPHPDLTIIIKDIKEIVEYKIYFYNNFKNQMAHSTKYRKMILR